MPFAQDGDTCTRALVTVHTSTHIYSLPLVHPPKSVLLVVTFKRFIAHVNHRFFTTIIYMLADSYCNRTLIALGQIDKKVFFLDAP